MVGGELAPVVVVPWGGPLEVDLLGGGHHPHTEVKDPGRGAPQPSLVLQHSDGRTADSPGELRERGGAETPGHVAVLAVDRAGEGVGPGQEVLQVPGVHPVTPHSVRVPGARVQQLHTVAPGLLGADHGGVHHGLHAQRDPGVEDDGGPEPALQDVAPHVHTQPGLVAARAHPHQVSVGLGRAGQSGDPVGPALPPVGRGVEWNVVERVIMQAQPLIHYRVE